MSKKNSGLEWGLAIGALAGLALGVLFAPTDGKKSRKKVKDAFENLNDKIEVEEAKKQISETYDLLKYNIERQFRILVNKRRAKKLRKAKELEKTFSLNAEIN